MLGYMVCLWINLISVRIGFMHHRELFIDHFVNYGTVVPSADLQTINYKLTLHWDMGCQHIPDVWAQRVLVAKKN